MNDKQQDKFEEHLRFVAKHYCEGAFDTERAWQQIAARRGLRRVSLVWRYGLPIAAAMLLLIGLGVGFWMERNRPDWVAVTTLGGETKTVFLPDSTEVALAGHSELRYDRKKYGKKRRVVQMKGKAFFQVRREKTRPFSVYTSQTTVTVLGTGFQIRESGALTEVYVATGKVRFAATSHPAEEVILTPGMSAGYSAENQEITVVAEEEGNALAWKTGRLQFHNTPLEKVIEDLNAYYQVRITNKVPAAGLKLTATFDRLPLGEVLMVINQTLDTQLVSAPEH